jgi:hypothetical protein
MEKPDGYAAEFALRLLHILDYWLPPARDRRPERTLIREIKLPPSKGGLQLAYVSQSA